MGGLIESTLGIRPAGDNLQTDSALIIRASELQGKRVRRENGEKVGRVYEIRLRHSEVTALVCGAWTLSAARRN
jgi:hypothetical protein